MKLFFFLVKQREYLNEIIINKQERERREITTENLFKRMQLSGTSQRGGYKYGGKQHWLKIIFVLIIRGANYFYRFMINSNKHNYYAFK